MKQFRIIYEKKCRYLHRENFYGKNIKIFWSHFSLEERIRELDFLKSWIASPWKMPFDNVFRKCHWKMVLGYAVGKCFIKMALGNAIGKWSWKCSREMSSENALVKCLWKIVLENVLQKCPLRNNLGKTLGKCSWKIF